MIKKFLIPVGIFLAGLAFSCVSNKTPSYSVEAGPTTVGLAKVEPQFKVSKIIYDTNFVKFPDTGIDGTLIQSAPIPQFKTAKQVIVVFLPTYKTQTKTHCLIQAPTIAPPPGQTWSTPEVITDRYMYTNIVIGGVKVYTSPVTTFHESIKLPNFNIIPAPLDFSGFDSVIKNQSFLPDLTLPAGTNWTIPAGTAQSPIRGYNISFCLGDGTNVVESVASKVQRLSFATFEAKQAQTTGTVTMYLDFIDGSYQIQIWE
jgi:hypothetical protein